MIGAGALRRAGYKANNTARRAALNIKNIAYALSMQLLVHCTPTLGTWEMSAAEVRVVREMVVWSLIRGRRDKVRRGEMKCDEVR